MEKEIWKDIPGYEGYYQVSNYGTKIKRQAEKIQTPVSQYDMKGKYIKTYKSIKQAYEETGIDKTGISMCSRGLLKTSGGYIWKKGGKNER